MTSLVGVAFNKEKMSAEAHEIYCADLKRIARRPWHIEKYLNLGRAVEDYMQYGEDLVVCACIGSQFEEVL